MNSQLLLMEMPEIKKADAELQNYQKQLISKGQDMVKKFEANYTKYVNEAQTGDLSTLEMQNRESQLQAERNAIQEYELEIQEKIGLKREELYKPLFDRVKEVITKYGKQNGYTMIFDTAITGALVHAATSDDITAVIKKELGL
ncbi:MAG TPA: OmpH family outer membrane protein [Saprospiraceae bacterium]|nr:OmpH family outer membrane protein [Saprospiraceae bacterium]